MIETAVESEIYSVDGHQLSFATTGPEALDRLCALIDGARSELQLLYYIFANDRAGRRVRDAVERARQRGVTTWLIIDGFGSEATPSRSEEHTSELQSLMRISYA